MKYLSLCLALGTALTLSACSTIPSKPKTFDQLGQFSAYPLNAQTFRISFQADSNMSYGTAEEITLVKSAQRPYKKASAFLKYKMTQVIKAKNHLVRLWFIQLHRVFIRMVMGVVIRVSGMIRSMISHKWSISTLFKCRILLNVIGIKSRPLKTLLMQR